MDRNSIISFVLIAAILGGYTCYTMPSAEEQARLQHVQDSLANVEIERLAREAEEALKAKEQAGSGTGTATLAPASNDTLAVKGDMLPESQAYQLWLIKDGHPTSGGVFNVNENGYRAVWVVSEDPLASYTSFDITLEPADGSTYPTGRTVLND